VSALTVDAGVTAIEAGAFAGCPIETLSPWNVVGDFAFSGIETLAFPYGKYTSNNWVSHLVFRPELRDKAPDSPEQRGAENKVMTSVTVLPTAGNSYIPAAYFYNFTALTSIPWETTLTSIGDMAFMNTKVGPSFMEAYATLNLTTIGKHAFDNVGIDTRPPKPILKLSVPLSSVGEGAFANNPNLTGFEHYVRKAAYGLTTGGGEVGRGEGGSEVGVRSGGRRGRGGRRRR
jgi:hypothetical protein